MAIKPRVKKTSAIVIARFNPLKISKRYIRVNTLNQEGQTVGEPKEFKMTLQCQGMKIDGVIREKIERKRLQEFIDKAVLT